MKPLVQLPNARRKVIDLLAAEFGPGVVGSSFPAATLVYPALRVQVELEATNVARYPVGAQAQIRVAVYGASTRPTGSTGSTDDVVRDAADRALRTLYAAEGDSGLAGVVPLIGPADPAVDPDTKNLSAWLVVRADLKASLLAS